MMRGKGIGLAVVALFAARTSHAALNASKVSEVWRSDLTNAVEISGVTWAGGDRYYAVDDADRKLYPLVIEIDRASGAIVTNSVGTGVPLAGAGDPEGCALDPGSGTVWVSDEKGARIREYDPATGAVLRAAPVPSIFSQCRKNFSFEALTISEDGGTMWTCNEEALECDGATSTKEEGSVVRLTRFTRPSPSGTWTAAGQWAYLTQPVGSDPWLRGGEPMTRSGVAGLCALPNGTLLVLERCLAGTGLRNATFFTRIFQVDFAGATEVSGLDSLKGADYSRVAKTPLFDENVGWANYEGICLGPRLDDGSRLLVLVADGGLCTCMIMTMKIE